MKSSTFDPKTMFGRSIRLHQTDRTFQSVQIKSGELT